MGPQFEPVWDHPNKKVAEKLPFFYELIFQARSLSRSRDEHREACVGPRNPDDTVRVFLCPKTFRREVYPDRGTSIGKPVWDHETLTILSGFFYAQKLSGEKSIPVEERISVSV